MGRLHTQTFYTRRRGQSGQSLVEVVIAIVLFSSVILAMAMAMFTINRTTVSNERVQGIDAALVTYGEILRSSIEYRPCRSDYNPTVSQGNDPNGLDIYDNYQELTLGLLENPSQTVVDGWLRPPAVIVEVEGNSLQSWDPETESFQPGCRVPDSGVQMISYSVTYDPGAMSPPREGDPVTRTGQVVKRKDGPS